MSVQIQQTGDIFSVGAQAIINPVNCVGVMGAGLALAFKRKFPEMFREYAGLCARGEIKVGHVWVWQYTCEFDWQDFGYPMYIINFPTKDDWRNPSQLQWIADGLDDLKRHATILELQSMALPALGCGKGGLSFDMVRPLIEQKLGDLSATITLIGPR